MGWIILSFLTSLFESGKDIVSKIRLSEFDAIIVAWALRLYSIPFLLAVSLAVPFPQIKADFWIALFAGGALNVWATILYMRALQAGDLSMVTPLVAFTPVLLLVSAPVILNEYPTFAGAAGVLLIVAGTVILNLEGSTKPAAAFRNIVRSKGSKYMLAVAAIWSVTSAVDKVGIVASSPIIWATSANLFIALAMIPLVALRHKGKGTFAIAQWRQLAPIGFLGALTLITQMTAVSLTNVAYVIAIKRLSIVFSVMAGGMLLKEKGAARRLVAAAIMALGVAMVTLFGLR